MKKLIYKLNFAIVGIMASSRVMAAGGAASSKGMEGICTLANEFGYIFNLMRTLAFIGAGFTIAGWAWGYISKGKVELKDVQEKGIGLLVGFVLLFGIGMVLSFLMSAAEPGGSLNCAAQFQSW